MFQTPKFWYKKSILSIILVPLLWPFSWIYYLIGKLRRYIAKPIKLPCYVICVGNATVGGTGKTPMVLFLARHYKNLNIKTIVVTKAYGGSLKGSVLVNRKHSAVLVGDEAKMLSSNAETIASKNIQSLIPLIEKLKPDLLIFDDGLQNPYFYKDFNILMIDGMRMTGNNLLFPAGPLRESLESAASKANLIVLSLEAGIENHKSIENLGKPIFDSFIEIKEVKKLPSFAFAGIGNPTKFFNSIERNDIPLVGTMEFPDHYRYSEKDIEEILIRAQKLNSKQILTTSKDLVKVPEKYLKFIKQVSTDIKISEEFLQYLPKL